MDLQNLVDGYCAATCVISVEKTDDGGYGEIRLVACNEGFAELVKKYDGEKYSGEFVPGRPYTDFFPKDLNFEDVCYRAAVSKKLVHTYVHHVRSDAWANVFVNPLTCDEGNVSYCVYSQEPSRLADLDLKSEDFFETSADVLKACIKLHDANDFKETMKEVVNDVREICKAEVCTIMLMDFEAGTCAVLATSIREGSTIRRVTQFGNFYDIAASWIKTIGESDCLIIKNEKDMEYISRVNRPWWLTLDEAGVKSVVMFPLRYSNEVLGYIWATNFDTRSVSRIKETLELTTYFLSSQIASYKMTTRLEEISYTDLLTGAKNRNAMNNRVLSIISGEEKLSYPCEVIFADLNGLKLVNDNSGHSAGDILLKKAALLLQETFSGYDVYRAGGDEFMAIVDGATKEEVEAKIAALQNASKASDGVRFAIGVHSCEPGCDIRDAMRYADEAMYKDKLRYYNDNPERKRRSR